MNRRKFLKLFLGSAIAAALPAAIKAKSNPVFEDPMIDFAKPDGESTVSAIMKSGEIGRYEGMVFIESTPQGNISWSKVDNIRSWDQEPGGYTLSDELSETLRGSLEPVNKYKRKGYFDFESENQQFINDELNKLRNKQLDNMMLVPKSRQAGRTYTNKALDKLIRDLNESFI